MNLDATQLRLTCTLKETAQLLGLSRGTVYRLVREGELRSVQARPGRRRSPHLIPRTEIERFVRQRLERSTQL